ncbi:toxin-antitoxin system TumE family protein [[Pseudomonas] boreopolis]|uniref:toxin-antitoxin system TumE family protein n=1 Tax=Xanthomonas boreopolis TaxID=86183 RepID=UPI003D4A323B
MVLGHNNWQLINIDAFVEEIGDDVADGATLDLFVACLSFKNFDDIEKRHPFLIECVTYDPISWGKLVAAAAQRFSIMDPPEQILVYLQTDHCGCVRTYRYRGREPFVEDVHRWVRLPGHSEFYAGLDTEATRHVFDAWHEWAEKTNVEATALSEGRLDATTVARSVVLSGLGGCIACASPAVANARTTLGNGTHEATLVHVPLCAAHMRAAQAEPNLLTYLASVFSLSLNLPPQVYRGEHIPDTLIPQIHTLVAQALGGTAGEASKRDNGWNLRIEMQDGWRWVLRFRSLGDYAYVLKHQDSKKAVYRADSAPHHPDLPFAPDHEHSRPDRKGDVCSPSFLYGNPLFDFERLRQVYEQHVQRSANHQ